jgi:hypothetical protein
MVNGDDTKKRAAPVAAPEVGGMRGTRVSGGYIIKGLEGYE